LALPGESGTEQGEGLAGARGRLEQSIGTGGAMREARELQSGEDLAHEGELRSIRLVREVDLDAANADGGVRERGHGHAARREEGKGAARLGTAWGGGARGGVCKLERGGGWKWRALLRSELRLSRVTTVVSFW
jgi:hypothetical protein